MNKAPKKLTTTRLKDIDSNRIATGNSDFLIHRQVCALYSQIHRVWPCAGYRCAQPDFFSGTSYGAIEESGEEGCRPRIGKRYVCEVKDGLCPNGQPIPRSARET